MIEAIRTSARWFAVLALLLLGARDSAKGAAPVPRYRFEPGQELRYSEQFVLDKDGTKHESAITWRVWVVRQNADGSWRLIIRHGTLVDDARPSRRGAKRESVQLAWCDFSPQGQATENDTLSQLIGAPGELLTRLPDDERAAQSGWTERWPALNYSNRCRLLADQSTADVAILETVREGFAVDVYGMEWTRKVSFDLKRGLPDKIDMSIKYASAQDGKAFASLKLDEIVLHDAAWCREFAAQAERYFAGADAYYLPMRDRGLSSRELKSGLEKVVPSLRQLRSDLGGSIFEPAIGEILANHGPPGDGKIYEGNYLDRARKRESLVGRRAADWTCTDFEGREHSLQDYRGRVVLLDFWFRNCYWCVQSMPQLKEIAAHFERQPVTLLGMNEDEEPEVAQLAIKNAKLNYLNLQARGIAREYQSPGSPGLVIIDQAGTIRDVHIGYSKDLKQRVVQSVEELLKKTP